MSITPTETRILCDYYDCTEPMLMDILQDNGLISDLCLTLDDIARVDVDRILRIGE